MIHDLLISIQDLLSSLLSNWKGILGTIGVGFIGIMMMFAFFDDQ